VYRTVSRAGRSRTWFEHNRQRFLQLLPVLANLLFVAPMLVDAFADSFLERDLPHRSVLTEIRSVLGYGALILLGYVVWLGWSQRRFLVADRARVPRLPAGCAGHDRSRCRAGSHGPADGRLGGEPGVEFVTKPGVLPELAEQERILVTARNCVYYVVREPSPPSPWATSYPIPFAAVDAAHVRPFNAPE
jgi:hypothetical protein